MKVLILNTNGYSGSIGRISYGLYRYLKSKGHEAVVCYRGIKEKKIDDKNLISLGGVIEFNLSVLLARMTGLESHFSFLSTIKLKRIIDDFKPDIIQLYNIHGNYIRSYAVLDYLKKKEIPVVYSMLDEFPYMGKCPYPLDCEKFKTECKNCPQKDKYPESYIFDQSKYLFHKKERCYRDFNNIVFTGPLYVCQRAKGSYLLKDKQTEVLNEPFNFDEYYYPRDTSDIKKELGIKPVDKVVVCASGTFFRKGGHFFIEVAKILENCENIKFVFIGYDYKVGWEFPSNVIVKETINDQNLFAKYMSLGDAYVCTSIGDTTPSVCLCAMGCGTPIIGFDYGGVRDCAPDKYGTYVPLKDIDSLAEAIKNCPRKTRDDITNIREYAISLFSQDSVYNKQIKLYNKILTKS